MKQLKLASTQRSFVFGLITCAAIGVPALAVATQPQLRANLTNIWQTLQSQTGNLLDQGERDLRLEPEAQSCTFVRENPSQTAWKCLGVATNYRTSQRVWDVAYAKDSLGIFVLYDSISGDAARYDVQCNQRSVEFLSSLSAQSRDPQKSLLEQEFNPSLPMLPNLNKLGSLPQLLENRLLMTCRPSQPSPLTPQLAPSPALPPVSAPSAPAAPAIPPAP